MDRGQATSAPVAFCSSRFAALPAEEPANSVGWVDCQGVRRHASAVPHCAGRAHRRDSPADARASFAAKRACRSASCFAALAAFGGSNRADWATRCRASASFASPLVRFELGRSGVTFFKFSFSMELALSFTRTNHVKPNHGSKN